MTEALRIRQAVRGLIMTPDSSFLLVKFKIPNRPDLWGTPGGGIEHGETEAEALNRELIEEVGLHDGHIGELLWDQQSLFKLRGGKYDGQRNKVFLVRAVDRFPPKPSMTWDQLNAECVYDIRWWSFDEICAAPSTSFILESFQSLVSDLVKNGPPANGPNIIGH